MSGWGFDSTFKNINYICEVYMNEKNALVSRDINVSYKNRISLGA